MNKRHSVAQACTLKDWEEVVGNLNRWRKVDHGLLVDIAGAEYFLPNFPEALVKRLQCMKGGSVGILRIEGSRYLIRSTCAQSKSPEPKQNRGEG